MPSGWTTSAGELLLAVDPSAPRKGEQLRLAIRQAIADGVLPPGTRLPSSRVLAADLGVSRGVVVDVYEQLTAEGWLAARRGSGTVVAARPSALDRPEPLPRQEVAELDLRPARPDVAGFPRSSWIAGTRSVLATLPHEDLTYGDHRGPGQAREVFAAYLARVRGVRTTPELLLLTNGFTEGLSSAVAGLVRTGVDLVATEDPGGYEPRAVVEAAGARTIPIPVDAEGMRVEALERSGAQAVLLTPAHQYPLGYVLGPERRVALAAWARQTGGWILEDDYDAEFRYDRAPIGAVQAVVPERTIYLGSVAKTLAPAIRVGWLVVPDELVGMFVATHNARESQQSTLDHLVVAHLVETGRYDRHLRMMRRGYRERRDIVLDVLSAAGLHGRVEGVAAGLHAVIRLDEETDDVALVEEIRARGVETVPLSRYAAMSAERGLVIGFGQQPPPLLRRGMNVIADVLLGHLGAERR